MTKRERVANGDTEMLFIDGADAALVGTGERQGKPALAVYDYHRLILVFERQGMSFEDAKEWVAYNILDAWKGARTPMVLFRADPTPFRRPRAKT